MAHLLPTAVGVNSALVLDVLAGRDSGTLSPTPDPFDRDTQLAWFILNELSFGGWFGVDDDAEWAAPVVSLRRSCEDWFAGSIEARLCEADEPSVLVDRILSTPGPSIARFLADHGTATDVAESLMLRLPYQDKEADPHTFAIPRLDGPVKGALCEIQSGEYGVGHRFSHAELFRRALASLGGPGFTSTIDRLPGVAFATSNLVSMGGLNRSRRGVVIGQLALFEMDSVEPNSAMVVACDRLGLPADARRFFQVHVLADAEHERIARKAFLHDYPGHDPQQRPNVVFGIRAQHAIDLAMADHAIAAWSTRRSALLGSARHSVAA